MTRFGFIAGCLLIAAGCADSRPQGESPTADPAGQPSVFDPLIQTLERTEDVQQTLEERAAEQRRRIEEAER